MRLRDIQISTPAIIGMALVVGIALGSCQATSAIKEDCAKMGITRATGDVMACALKEAK